MPPPRKAQPKPAPSLTDSDDRTDPGGPSPEILAKARKDVAVPKRDDEPVAPGPGDATLVYDKNKGRPRGAAELPRLVVTAGPRKGSEHSLADDRTSIGRGSDNVFVVPDISVSRQHVVIEREGERWVVKDLGSGNGTRVNGKSIERHFLKSGDEVAIGDTVVQFVEPGGIVVKGGRPASAAPAPRETPEVTSNAKPKQANKRVQLYLALGAALAFVLVLGTVRKMKRERLEAEAAAHGEESRQLAQQRFQEGVTLLKAGKWSEARDKLKVAAELDGQDAEITRYLETAETEAPRAQALAAARTALGRKDYAAARAAVANVPDDSALVDQAREVQQQIRNAMDEAVRDARARVEAGDTALAAELLDPVLAAEPARPDALAVRDALGGARRSQPAAQQREREPARREKAQPERRETTAAAATPDVSGILDAYLAGDIGAALQQADRASANPKAARLLSELRRFDAAYKDGLARQQQGRTAEALRAFDQASLADRAIANGREGRLGREVRKASAALHLQAAQSLGTEEATLAQAASHLRAAVQADPGNEAAQSLSRQVADKAKEIYLRAYMAKDSEKDVARSGFKLVIDVLPASDDSSLKAKRWLDKLDGKVAKDE